MSAMTGPSDSGVPLPARVLDAADPFCPKCGHNRDKSSVSSIDMGDGRRYCQMCRAEWVERAALPVTEGQILALWAATPGFWTLSKDGVAVLYAFARALLAQAARALPVAALSDAEILEIAHRKASTYAHRSDPGQHAYGFVRHTLLDFARALLAAAGEPTAPDRKVMEQALSTFNQVLIDAQSQDVLWEWWSEMEDRLAALRTRLLRHSEGKE